MLAQTDILVEPIEPADFDAIWAIFLEEGWVDYQKSDLDYLVGSSPETCFKFLDEGRIVGAMFANILPCKVGFLGPIILDKEYRKNHWGRILPHTLMLSQYLDLSTRACVLYSAQHMKKLYQELGGFSPRADFSRFKLKAEDMPAPEGDVVPMRAADLPEVKILFRQAYGDDRDSLLERFPRLPGTRCLIARGGSGEVAGFIMLRKSLMGFNLGPCLAGSIDIAADLIKAAARQVSGESLILQGEIERTRFLLAFGGIPYEPTSVVSTKMIKGDIGAFEHEDLIHSVFSFYLS
jgi:hypothetical protein